jgi:hypothetical protein
MTCAEIRARSPLEAARQRNLTQPNSEAQPGGRGPPVRAERREPRSGALDGLAERSYTPGLAVGARALRRAHRTETDQPTGPPATPVDWVRKPGCSIKGSDTPHTPGSDVVYRASPAR